MESSAESVFSGALTSQLADVLETLAAWVLQPAIPPPVIPSWDRAAWQAFGHLAYLQGVLPLLRGPHFFPHLPAEIQEAAATGYDFNHQRNQRLLAELVAVLTCLQRAGIRAMPLKGSVLLLERAYPNAADRVLHDLDILVPPQDLGRAQAALQILHYHVENVTWRHIVLRPPGESGIASWTYDHPDNPRQIDLHSQVREDFRGITLDLTDYLWQSARSTSVAGTPAWLPARSSLLHHLATHSSVSVLERQVRLGQLVDLDYLSIWLSPAEVVAGLAPLTRAEARFLYPAVQLTTTYSPSPTLAAANDRLMVGVSPRLARWAGAGRLSNRTFLARTSPPGETLRFWPETPPETWTVLRHTLFHSRSELAALYPRLAASRWYWLSYPRFWTSLVLSLGRRSWHALTTREISDGQ